MRLVAVTMLALALATTVASAQQGPPTPADEMATCQAVGPIMRQQVEAAKQLQLIAEATSLLPENPYDTFFDGPELEAVVALSKLYPAMLAELQTYLAQLETVATVLETCAAAAPATP